MFLEKTPFHTRQKGVLYLRKRTIGLTVRLLVWSKDKCNELVDFTAIYLLTFKGTKPSSLFTPCFIVAFMNLS
jgi:hypothetical protein